MKLLFPINLAFVCIALLSGCGGSSSNDLSAELPDPQTDILDVDVDIISRRVSGDLLVNSLTNNPNNFSDALFYIKPVGATAENSYLGAWSDLEFDVSIIAGTYQAVFVPGGAQMPLNFGEVLLPTIEVQNDLIQSIDVQTVDVTLVPTLNGEVFPTDINEVAAIYLESNNAAVSFPIFIGLTNTTINAVKVIPGSYKLIYEHQSGDIIPGNKHAVIIDDLQLIDSTSIPIPVKSATLRSSFQLQGENFPNSGLDFAHIHLRNSDGDEVFLGPTNQNSVSSRQVIYGLYNAHYSFRESSTIPRNSNAIIAENILIDEDVEQVTLDVGVITINGSFTVNGASPSASGLIFARIYLRDAMTGSQIFLGNTNDQDYESPKIIPGSYDLVYDFRESVDGSLPRISDAIFQRNQPILSTGVYNIDIPVATVTLELSLNGEPFPQSGLDFGNIYFHEESSDATNFVGPTYEDLGVFTLLHGSYDFFFDGREFGLSPNNSYYKFIDSLTIDGDIALSHDFLTREVRVVSTLNGGGFPGSENSSANIYIGTSDEDEFVIRKTHEEAGVFTLISDTYFVKYEVRESFNQIGVPINEKVTVMQLDIE